jgi:predicted metal-dependent phosphoesterase TrpH
MCRRSLAACVLSLVAALAVPMASPASGQSPRPLAVPDIPGYVTLKADFHLHSVFSDGEVWPTVHVREAWRDGLDVIALTEHVEYRPHRAHVSGGPRASNDVARPLAEKLGLLLVPGAEITRPVPGAPADIPVGSAHFNVLFASDVEALETPDLAEALRRAQEQGAFVFWDHPGFMDAPAQWFPHTASLYDAGLFAGIEVVNGDRFYPEALEWARDRRLTPIAASDAHQPMPAHLKKARRPVTLLFARTRDLAGVKDALVSRRTLAWLDTGVWGDVELLRALWTASVSVEPTTAAPGGEVTLTLTNRSSIDFDVEIAETPDWLALTGTTLVRERPTLMAGRLSPSAPAGRQAPVVRLRIRNLQPAAGVPLDASITLPIVIAR